MFVLHAHSKTCSVCVRTDTFLWLHIHVLSVYVYTNVCSCVCFFLCRSMFYMCLCMHLQVRLAHRVRRCCRALLTAAENQSTLSVYSPTRRFLNDLPWQACCLLPAPLNGWPAPISNMLMTQREKRREERMGRGKRERVRYKERNTDLKLNGGWAIE